MHDGLQVVRIKAVHDGRETALEADSGIDHIRQHIRISGEAVEFLIDTFVIGTDPSVKEFPVFLLRIEKELLELIGLP